MSSTTDSLLHSCSLTVDLTQNPFQHVTDQPILDPDTPHWFIDGVLPVVRVPGQERRLLETMQLAVGEFITDSSQGLPPSPRV